jgi:aspartyl-tRNA(Asn)/glutamyl-tRNA(Gln) amidotransferase subunit C
MIISRDDVQRVAQLARLNLTEDEADSMTRELEVILDYVARLDELDLSNVEPTFHAHGLSQPLREDRIQPGLTVEESLQNAPDSDGSHFVVPKVV